MFYSARSGRQALTLAHEYMHIVQLSFEPSYARPKMDEIPFTGPQWITEGIAEYMAGFSELSYRRTNTRAPSFDEWIEDKIFYSGSINASLKDLATLSGMASVPRSYNLSTWAVGLLAERSGTSSLFEYFKLTGSTGNWREAFQQAFGLSVDDFYENFELLRS